MPKVLSEAAIKQYREENREYIQSQRKKYRDKNPRSSTPIMTKYRQSHRECEFQYCDQTKSLHVHHILPKFKYPEGIDGDYKGSTGNNFICYCPFHHYAYHYIYATERNEKKHETALGFLRWGAEQWAIDNKIPIEDLVTDLAHMI